MSALTRRGLFLSSLVTGAMLSTPLVAGSAANPKNVSLTSPRPRTPPPPKRNAPASHHSASLGQQQQQQQHSLNLVLLGDVMLGRIVDDSLAFSSSRRTQAFGDVLPFIKRLDPATTIVAGNLECAVTSHEIATPKAFNFKLDPSRAGVLQELQLSYVSLANNHVLDYGQPGLQETHEVLDRLGIAHSGSGLQPAAAAAAVVERGGIRVAFLSYADHYDHWAASSSRPGINFINPASFDPAKLLREVAAVRALAVDLVVVFVHWGPNWCWQPDGDIQALGLAWLDAGADLVFGHSAHHVQGVQMQRGRKAVIYGAGPFIDDYAVEDEFRNDLGCLWLASFTSSSGGASGDAATDASSPVSSSGKALETAAAAGGGAAGVAAAAGSGGSGSPQLQLQRLVAVPLFIHQDWREGEHRQSGQGLPPYLPQVDLARGEQRQWVVNKLKELCREFGTGVSELPDTSGLQLTGAG